MGGYSELYFSTWSILGLCKKLLDVYELLLCALWHSTGWDIFDSLAALRLCRLMPWLCARSINCIAGNMAHYAESICNDGGYQQTCYLGILKNATTCCKSRGRGGGRWWMPACLSQGCHSVSWTPLRKGPRCAFLLQLCIVCWIVRHSDFAEILFCSTLRWLQYAGGADEHCTSFHFAFSLHLNQHNNWLLTARQPHTWNTHLCQISAVASISNSNF